MSPNYPKTYNCQLLHEKILITCRERSDKKALLRSEQPLESYTYGRIEQLIPRVAASLKKYGVNAGDRIGILSENRPEWGIAYLSILSAGGVVVPFDPVLKSDEIINLVRLSGVKIVFVSEKYSAAISSTMSPSEELSRCIDLAGLNEMGKTEAEPFINSSTRPDDPAVLIYTSGTTGDPKGVILTHRNITANLESIAEALIFVPEDVVLSLLPLHHTFEATCGFLTPLSHGHTIVYARSFKSRDIIEDIKKYQVTYMVGVPLLYEKMYLAMRRRITELPLSRRKLIAVLYSLSKLGWRLGVKSGKILFSGLRKKAGLSSIRMFVSGGAPLSAEIAEWFNLIGFDFLEGYGLTECAPVVSVNQNNNIRFGSVGPPLPRIEVAIKEPADDGAGEIIIRGENITPGYLDNQHATVELLKNGWLNSGDLGVLEKGHLYIKGRAKSLIVTAGGKNIYPEEIEEIICRSPLILEALVLGRTIKQHHDEKIYAIVVPDLEVMQDRGIIEATKHNTEAIYAAVKSEIDNVNGSLAAFKRISDFELRFEEFEKTSTKKIKRTLYK